MTVGDAREAQPTARALEFAHDGRWPDDRIDLARLCEQFAEERCEGEREARHKCEDALRKKDAAMGVLFERLSAAGVDCSDLIS